MPETGIYLCDADMLEAGKQLFAGGASLVLDDEYETPQFPMISSVAELERSLAQRPHALLFFVVSPAWQVAPLEMKSMVKGNRTIFYHAQKSGGPTLDIYYPRPFQVANGAQLRPGFIAYHAKYWNSVSGALEEPPAALGDAYKGLRALLSKGGRKVKEGARTFIVTAKADRLGVTLSAGD
jgi:hypothetical protein